MKPLALKKGDLIGIAASASPFDKAAFMEGVRFLEELGFGVYYRPDIFDKKHYLAGSDERRATELTELFDRPDIKAVLFARGGYGMMRLLPYLDSRKLNPKIVLGYSDITSLLIYLHQKYQLPTFYGPVVAKDLSAATDPLTRSTLLQALTAQTPLPAFAFEKSVCVQAGVAEGEVTGGCLTLVVASLGTPYEIETEGKILFFEDTNEKPYSVDRMLTQLSLAGKLKKAKGMVFGNFVNGGDPNHFRETIEDVLRDFQGPVLYDFPAGHGPVKVTLPLGVRARLNSTEKKLEFLENACA